MKNGLTAIYQYSNENYLNAAIEKIFNQSISNIQLVVLSCHAIDTLAIDISDKNIKFVKCTGNTTWDKIIEVCEYDNIYFLCDYAYPELDSSRILIDSDADVKIGNILYTTNGKIYYFNKSPFIYENKIGIDYKEFIEYGFLGLEYWSLYNKIFTMKVVESSLKDKEVNICSFEIITSIYKIAKKIASYKNTFFYFTTIENGEINSNFANYFLNNHLANSNNDINYAWKYMLIPDEIKLDDSLAFIKEEVNYYNSSLKEVDNYFFEYLDIKKKIMDDKIKYVSFDLFDTLIKREFLRPTDLFVVLDDYYNKNTNNRNYLYFSQMRINAENECRAELRFPIEEVTIDDIYIKIKEKYCIEETLLEEIKLLEEKLEIKHCIKRESGFELYNLAKYLKKDIILISDIYLNSYTITDILKKNNYQFSEIFISSKTKRLKHTGNAFKNAMVELKATPEEILHIGDNLNSDVNVPKSLGINAVWLPSILFVTENSNWYQSFNENDIDKNYMTYDSMDFIGNKCFMATIVNELYDYPYFTDYDDSFYNGSSNVIGVIPVSLAIFGFLNKIHKISKEKSYRKLHFAARDGYLLMEAYKSLYPEEVDKINYLYMSRKLLIPLSIKNKEDFWSLKFSKQDILLTPERIYGFFSMHLDLNETEFKKICEKLNFPYLEYFNESKDLERFIRDILIKHFDGEKSRKFMEQNYCYYKDLITPLNVIIDVGYSGRTEIIMSNLLGYPLDSIYIHSKGDLPFNRANKENFSIATLIEYLPKITGSIREYIFSKADATCVRYNFEKKEYEFEKIKFDNLELATINNIQNSCLNIIKLYSEKFKEYNFIVKEFELNEMLEKFYYSPCIKDAEIFKVFRFEDELNFKDSKYYNLFDLWIGYINETSNSKYSHISSENSTQFVTDGIIKRNILKRIIIKVCKPLYTKMKYRMINIVKEANYDYYKSLEDKLNVIESNNRKVEKILKKMNKK